MKTGRINVHLIVGGKYHDFDFARLELLKLLHEDDRLRVRVAEDYANFAALDAADFLITYTCDVVPDERQLAALKKFLVDGKRWFALHGTNSVIEFLQDGRIDCPDKATEFMEMLGTQFAAHPPIGRYRVEVSDPDHPLTAGLRAFEVEDELYLSRKTAHVHLLLETRFQGNAAPFVMDTWDMNVPHPVFYLRRYGRGEVLYLTLGHCRGKYDLQELGVDVYDPIERCSWQSPVYYDLLRRGIRWAAGEMA